jgi:hypothetical protein
MDEELGAEAAELQLDVIKWKKIALRLFKIKTKDFSPPEAMRVPICEATPINVFSPIVKNWTYLKPFLLFCVIMASTKSFDLDALGDNTIENPMDDPIWCSVVLLASQYLDAIALKHTLTAEIARKIRGKQCKLTGICQYI